MSSLGILLFTLFVGIPFSFVLQAVLLNIFAIKLNFILKLVTLFLTVVLQLVLVCAVIPELDEPLANTQLSVTLAIILWLVAIAIPWLVIRPRVARLQT